MGMFDDLVPQGTTLQNSPPSGSGMFSDLVPAPKAIDWSGVRTSADLQKVLDDIPDPNEKTAALHDWARQHVQKEAEGGLVPHAMPSAHVLGAGLIDDLDAGVNAGISYLTGGQHGNTFEQEKALQKARQDYIAENSSPLAKAAALAGGLAVSTRLPMAAPFSDVSLLGRTGNAVLTGAGYGGIEGATHGDTLGDRALNTAEGIGIGGVAGGVLEPLATGVGNVARYAADKYRGLPQELNGMSRGAVDRVARAMTDDNLPASFAQQSQNLGREGMLADMGPNLRDQAGAIANRPGAGQTILRHALDQRNAGAPRRISQDIDAAFGPEQNLVQLERTTVNGANAAAAPHYAQFEAAEIPMTDELHAALQEAQHWGAVPEAVRMSRGQSLMPRAIDRLVPDVMTPITGLRRQVTDLVPTGRELDYVKRALDARARKAFDNGDTHLGVLINNTARRLTNEIDRILSPGDPATSPYAMARAVSGTGQQFEEGLREGSGVFTRPKTHNPDVVADNLAQGSPTYQAGFRAGARGDLANMANDASTQFGPAGDRALRRGMFSTNAERKIQQLANSPQDAQRVLNRRDAESTFAETRNAVTQNSATARRQAAQKEFPAPAEKSNTANHLGETLTGLAVGAGKKLVNAATLGQYNARLAQMAENAARILSATGQDRDRFFIGLTRHLQSRGASAQQAQAISDAVRRLLPAATTVGTRSATVPQ
jgi:hypothetical protein